MKIAFKSSISIISILLFVVACFLGVIVFLALGWLKTYRVFTQETAVAEITISAQKTDEKGPYADVTVTQIRGRSPLVSIFNPDDKTQDDLSEPTQYKIYGDYVEIGGPVMKFENFMALLNFETVYKIALLNGAYVTDRDLEKNRTEEMFSRFELNGGFANWKGVQEDVQDGNLRGKIIDIFIDSIPQIDPKGVFVTKKEQNLTLCVTEEGFRFCDKEI